ncbi:IS1 family transposase, partial [Flavobacterium psychrophilum]|nr:IS1 family transposase [Flavobacterium psychrophilum]
MTSLLTLCSKCVGNSLKCLKCDCKVIKYGKTKSGKQRYLCRKCSKSQVDYYTYNAYNPELNKNIILLTKEGLGIRSTARILKIATSTLLKRIVFIANSIENPIISFGKEYEVDEMRTFIKHKKNLIWIVYALEKKSKKVVSFNIGKRTNKTLNFVLNSLKLSKSTRIYTDKLKNYKYLLNKKIHSTKLFGKNHIERNNLTIRTHLKRLNRKTICYSKSSVMLTAILKL